jgi:hypothetical protein
MEHRANRSAGSPVGVELFQKQAGKSPHSPFALTIGFVRRFVGDQERPSFLRLDAVIVRGRIQKHPATADSPSGNCR